MLLVKPIPCPNFPITRHNFSDRQTKTQLTQPSRTSLNDPVMITRSSSVLSTPLTQHFMAPRTLTKTTARCATSPPAGPTTDTTIPDQSDSEEAFSWNWLQETNLCWFIGMVLLGACAPFVYEPGAVRVSVVLALLSGFGITLGYHRLLSHRAFKVPKLVEYFFAYCGAHALQFLHNTYFWHPAALATILYLYGGFPYLAWGMGMRLTVLHMVTYIQSYVNHSWGERAWNTHDTSTNSWWVAMLCLGEGWHNNHHAFPKSARHGLEWWQLDLTWELIKSLKTIGLATNIKVPTKMDKERMSSSRSNQMSLKTKL